MSFCKWPSNKQSKTKQNKKPQTEAKAYNCYHKSISNMIAAYDKKQHIEHTTMWTGYWLEQKKKKKNFLQKWLFKSTSNLK